jgi:hypothetical protein
MQSVCSALRPWETALRTRSSALQPKATATAAERGQDVQRFLSAVIADTSTAARRLKQAGTPDVPAGSRLAANVLGSFGRLKATYARAARQAASLPVGNVPALQNAIAHIAKTVDSSLADVGTQLSALEATGKLKAAEAKAPACRQLAGAA